MGQHSNIGASSSSRWMKCTSSPSLIATLDPSLQDTSSIFADEGSAAHRLADLGVQRIARDLHRFGKDNIRDCLSVDLQDIVLAKRIDTGDYDVVGNDPFDTAEPCSGEDEVKLHMNDHVFRSDFEMEDGVRKYLETVIDIVEDSWGPRIQSETRTFPFPALDDVYGTSDCVIWDDVLQKIWVLDFKYGKYTIVHAEGNSQARFYGLGAVRETSYEDSGEVNLIIVQPRVEFVDGGFVSQETLTVGEIVAWGDFELLPAIEATKSPALAQYVVGDYCQFCPAMAVCPLVDSMAAKQAKEAFGEGLDTMTFEDVPDVQMILPSADDGESLAKAFRIAAVLKRWAAAVENLVQVQAQKGVEVPGMKAVRAITRRKWKDEAALLEALEKKGMLDVGASMKPLTPAQMEKTEIGKEFVEQYSEKPEGGIEFVPESNRRKAVEGAKDVFSKIEG